jgi:hypothetical protein
MLPKPMARVSRDEALQASAWADFALPPNSASMQTSGERAPEDLQRHRLRSRVDSRPCHASLGGRTSRLPLMRGLIELVSTTTNTKGLQMQTF